MTKDIILSITGLQTAVFDDGSANEPIEVICPASYYEKNGKIYLLYEEMDETAGTLTLNTIKITPGSSFEMIKNGTVTSHMIFEEGHTTNNSYQTPFGEFNLGVTAQELTMLIEEELLEVSMQYTLDVNYEPAASCSLHLKAVPRGSDCVRLK